jgi:multicomponent Na+:H+ antiporter subunit D
MAEMIPVAFLFFTAALVLPVLPSLVRSILLLGVPVLSGLIAWSLPEGMLWQVGFFGFELELMRVDPLSRIFTLIFSLAAFLGNLYAWHVRDTVQQRRRR